MLPLSPDKQAVLSEEDCARCYQIKMRRTELGKHKDADRLRVRQASMGPMGGRLLYRLAKSLKPKRILEVGTCVGIGAAYMIRGAVSDADHRPIFIGTEGVEEKRELAIETLSQLGKDADWMVIGGNFDDTLEETIDLYGPFDLAYIDGQHEGEKTIRNFQWVIDSMLGGGVVVLDDINGPRNMQKAKRHVLTHRRVTQRVWLSGMLACEIKAV